MVDAYSFVDTELVEGYRQFMTAPFIRDEEEHTFTLAMYASKIEDNGDVIGPFNVLADDNTGTVVDFIKGDPTITN